MNITENIMTLFKTFYDRNMLFLIKNRLGLYNSMSDEEFIKKMFKVTLGYNIDLNNPRTFNEKLQWLKLNYRRNMLTKLVDKYAVRGYVSKKLGEEYLIPLLGVWNNPEEIDFSTLGSSFVLKCNHNSGLGMCICKNINKIDIKKITNELRKGLSQDYYLIGREWPYKNVPRKIIAEEYLVDESGYELRDYKFYCFNGRIKMVLICSDRFSAQGMHEDFFDADFSPIMMSWDGYKKSEKIVDKPHMYEQMVSIAEVLSEDFPFVRVDLYLANNKIYFGELTFFPAGGFGKIEPKEWDYQMGAWLKLPHRVIEGGSK